MTQGFWVIKKITLFLCFIRNCGLFKVLSFFNKVKRTRDILNFVNQVWRSNPTGPTGGGPIPLDPLEHLWAEMIKYLSDYSHDNFNTRRNLRS